MRIDSDQTIAGQPALRIRDFFKRERDRSWTTATLRQALVLSVRAAGRVVARLEAEGYIVHDCVYRGRPFWRVAPLGRRLAHAKGARPITRRAAERLLKQFLKRVEEVNANSYYVYRVTCVAVFGSYLTDKAKLGDIDLAVTLEPREADHDRHLQRVRWRAANAREEGRRFSTFVDELGWAEKEVRQYLKGRSPYIAIHGPDDGVLKITTQKVLYEAATAHSAARSVTTPGSKD